MMKDWIPLISKLVWPLIILSFLLFFRAEVKNFYNIMIERAEKGSGIEVVGFIKIGQALVNETKISQLSFNNISIQGIGGAGSVVRKDSMGALNKLKRELRKNPSRIIDTLLIEDDRRYSIELLKEYISELSLRYVVFKRGDIFDGWMNSTAFITQLPNREEITDIDGREILLSYEDLKSNMVGIRKENLKPNSTVMEVLEEMKRLHVDAIPVVNDNGHWQFFAIRGEILSQIITSVLLNDEQSKPQ